MKITISCTKCDKNFTYCVLNLYQDFHKFVERVSVFSWGFINEEWFCPNCHVAVKSERCVVCEDGKVEDVSVGIYAKYYCKKCLKVLSKGELLWPGIKQNGLRE